MSAKKPANTKQSIRIKQRRRKWLTFGRMCRYGVNNFSRNAWLTVAATAVMSVTLLIIFVSVSAQQVLSETVANISRQADMSIYLKGNTPENAVNEMKSRLEKLDNGSRRLRRRQASTSMENYCTKLNLRSFMRIGIEDRKSVV